MSFFGRKIATLVSREEPHWETPLTSSDVWARSPVLDRAVCKMNPPYLGHEYVVFSRSDVPFSGLETYIFSSDEHGNITDWLELAGSEKGNVFIEDLVRRIGYALETNNQEHRP